MTRKTVFWILAAGFSLGLLVRYCLLFEMGVTDMDEYYKWGKRALEVGLIRSYHGIYFPLQYQSFEVCAAVVLRIGIKFFTVFKLANLAFDVGLFSLLILLLQRHELNPIYALVYWLHPWFLTVFSLGYVDFQFAFFVVLSIWLLRSDIVRDYLLAGLPLGCAFVMKPQAQILVLVTFLYGCFHWLRTKNARALAMLTGPVVFFLAYEWLFVHTLRRPRFVHAAILPSSYLNVTNIMPALTAQMPNVWSPVAYLLRKQGQHIYAVSDQVHLLPYVPARYVAIAIVLLVITLYVYRIERNTLLSPNRGLMFMIAFASVVVPFLMTSAHENHLFLGTIFLIPMALVSAPGSVKAAVHLLLVVQLLNLLSLYGLHPRWLSVIMKRAASDELSVCLSIAAVLCFAVIARYLWRRSTQILSSPDLPESVCS